MDYTCQKCYNTPGGVSWNKRNDVRVVASGDPPPSSASDLLHPMACSPTACAAIPTQSRVSSAERLLAVPSAIPVRYAVDATPTGKQERALAARPHTGSIRFANLASDAVSQGLSGITVMIVLAIARLRISRGFAAAATWKNTGTLRCFENECAD